MIRVPEPVPEPSPPPHPPAAPAELQADPAAALSADEMDVFDPAAGLTADEMDTYEPVEPARAPERRLGPGIILLMVGAALLVALAFTFLK
jgi:hypothetical protein